MTCKLVQPRLEGEVSVFPFVLAIESSSNGRRPCLDKVSLNGRWRGKPIDFTCSSRNIRKNCIRVLRSCLDGNKDRDCSVIRPPARPLKQMTGAVVAWDQGDDGEGAETSFRDAGEYSSGKGSKSGGSMA